MQVRVDKIKSGRKVYHYTRLVRSIRRKKDKQPTHKVVANLGQLPPQETENLKIAFQAAREGKAVVVADKYTNKIIAVPNKANLDYLDIMVSLEMWNDWGLSPLLDKIMPRQQDDVSPASIVSALAI